MIEWTNQIRDFISNQETMNNRDDEDVLNEIKFWDDRNMNLSNISLQLEFDDLNLIVNLLTKASSQSDNLANFNSYRKLILEEKKTAEEILKFIKLLSDDCTKLMNAEIKNMPEFLNILLELSKEDLCKELNISEENIKFIQKELEEMSQ